MNFCKEKRIIKEPLKKIGIILQIKSVNIRDGAKKINSIILRWSRKKM